MKYTSNHNFKLPAPSDTIDVEVLNENFTNIDALIKTLESAKADKNSPSFTGAPNRTDCVKQYKFYTDCYYCFCAGTDTRHTDGIVQAKRTKNSPSFTGTPKSPTPPSSDISTRIATNAFVQNLVQAVDKKKSPNWYLQHWTALMLCCCFDKDNISTLQ